MVVPLTLLKKKLEEFLDPKSTEMKSTVTNSKVTKLAKTLHIIYYHGHGGLEHHEDYGKALSLTR